MFFRKLASCSGPVPNHPRVRRVWWLAVAVRGAGCGSTDPTVRSSPLSCTLSDGCVDYTGTGWTLSSAPCSPPSTPASSACPTANLTGSCTFEVGSALESVLRSYSPLLTTTAAQSVCTTKGGVFERPVCTPDCAGKTCGPDGCEGSCGTCEAGTCSSAGTCGCAPDCTGKTCGDDGCGGSCGTCDAGMCSSAGTCSQPPSVCHAAPTINDCEHGTRPRACGSGICGSVGCEFVCPGVSQCFSTEAEAHESCGGSCRTCGPNPCHDPPTTNACTDEDVPRDCGSTICGGTECDFVCPDVRQCFASAGDAQEVCGSSCRACGPVPD